MARDIEVRINGKTAPFRRFEPAIWWRSGTAIGVLANRVTPERD